VHIKAFTSTAYGPSDADLISYELAKDESGRFLQKIFSLRRIRYHLVYLVPLARSALIFPFFLEHLSYPPLYLVESPLAILGLYFASSIVTFIVYAIDKSSAQHGRRRTNESTLHMLGLFGGWPGALFAQKILHHKSKKQEFQTVFGVSVISNCFALG
jgi:uncharacterized membrane protein YsdA (DUF1294 family)